MNSIAVALISLTILNFVSHYCYDGAAVHRPQGTREDFGNVLIVVSRGRSGSEYVCGLVANIVAAGADVSEFYREVFGTYDEMRAIEEPLEHMKAWLRERRAEHHASRFIGFKWKPIVDSAAYDEVWRYVAQQKWPVVYNVRNPLDVYISEQKSIIIQHKEHAKEKIYHCRRSNAECLEEHYSIKPKIDPQQAIERVASMIVRNRDYAVKLRSMGIRLYQVSYDEIVSRDDQGKVDYLQPLVRFLQPNLVKSLHPIDTRVLKIDIAPTSIGNSVRDKVENWEELEQAFNQSEYAFLLH